MSQQSQPKNRADMPNIPLRGGGGRGGPRHMMQHEKPKHTKATFKRLLGYLGAQKKLLFGLLLIMLFSSACSLIGPSLQGAAVNYIARAPLGKVFEVLHLNRLWRILLAMLAVYLLSALATYTQGVMAATLSKKTVRKMRNDLFQKITYLPIRYTDSHRHGDLMSRMTNDVDNISNTISQSISSLFSAFIMVIGSFSIMMVYSWKLTLISILTIPVVLLSTTLLGKVMRKQFKKQQTLLGKLNSHIEESVTGYPTILTYGQQSRFVDSFSETSEELRKAGTRAQTLGGCMGPIMNFIHNLGFLVIAVAGGYFAYRGEIAIGTILVFINYSKQFNRPINEMANQYASILTAIAGAERIFEVMDAETEGADQNPDLDLASVKGAIRFEDVTFGYNPEKAVLKGFSLDVSAGSKIAIVGHTGSGKTTIVNLLTRFYDIDTGRILLDGVDIASYSRTGLRSAIAIVLQDTVLFSGTVAENIRYGKQDASDEAVRAAAKTANAHTFIERLPQQYDTPLGVSGGAISQGQKQLLAIARAVLADPKILILDEATSSVDTRTELAIQSALLHLMQNRTSFIIAHRLSTIRDADAIIVLDDGRIVESGNHEDLLAKKGTYYRLYQTQFAGIAT